MRTIEQKREAIRARITEAEKRIKDGMAEGLPAYIIRARRNTLFVACSDAALLEALIIRGDA